MAQLAPPRRTYHQINTCTCAPVTPCQVSLCKRSNLWRHNKSADKCNIRGQHVSASQNWQAPLGNQALTSTETRAGWVSSPKPGEKYGHQTCWMVVSNQQRNIDEVDKEEKDHNSVLCTCQLCARHACATRCEGWYCSTKMSFLNRVEN